jgi:hypothetical protein
MPCNTADLDNVHRSRPFCRCNGASLGVHLLYGLCGRTARLCCCCWLRNGRTDRRLLHRRQVPPAELLQQPPSQGCSSACLVLQTEWRSVCKVRSCCCGSPIRSISSSAIQQHSCTPTCSTNLLTTASLSNSFRHCNSQPQASERKGKEAQAFGRRGAPTEH